MTRPFCANCEKLLRRKTEMHYFSMPYSQQPLPECKTKEEALQHIPSGHRITGVLRWGDLIGRVRTWDGKSYEEGPFCKPKCAQEFGHVAYRSGFRR